MSGRSRLSWPIVAAVVLLAAAARLQAGHDRMFPAIEQLEEPIYISSPTALRRLTVGFSGLAADLYWIRAIQYYGGAKRRLQQMAQRGPEPPPLLADTSDYQYLYELLDLTTSLDPRFNIAYRFGAIFLAEGYPAGPGRPDLAIALLRKGLRERPDKWQYMEDTGFICYWYMHDYRCAADAFSKAADIPDAPNWLRPLAATTLAQGGDRRTSRAMWLSILESAEVDWLRSQAEHRLLQLQALDQIDALQARVAEYTKRTGEQPREWAALIRSGLIRGVPVDPAGTPYALTSAGEVGLGAASPLAPLPTEPLQLGAVP
ncbi:MAG TPA: hypothetical protein VFB07_01985 [Vicinamibacterales bacterium]|nr:hypothetical protein [Vicinamibacterales bacterium]